MSPKKTILRELLASRARPEADGYVRPPTIPGWSARPERFQQAVNDLLRDRLVEGKKDREGHMTIALNEHRLGEVERVLRPIWARPFVWAVLAAVLAVGAVAVV